MTAGGGAGPGGTRRTQPDGGAAVPLTDQQSGDQEAGQDEEEVHAQVAAVGPVQAEVIGHHRSHGQGPEPVERRHVVVGTGHRRHLDGDALGVGIGVEGLRGGGIVDKGRRTARRRYRHSLHPSMLARPPKPGRAPSGDAFRVRTGSIVPGHGRELVSATGTTQPVTSPGRPPPTMWMPSGADGSVSPGWFLVPLRLFLGGTFLFAGLQKLANPQFFSNDSPISIHAQLVGATHVSPIHALVAHLVPVAHGGGRGHRRRGGGHRARRAGRSVDAGGRRRRHASLLQSVPDGELPLVAVLHRVGHRLLLRLDPVRPGRRGRCSRTRHLAGRATGARPSSGRRRPSTGRPQPRCLGRAWWRGAFWSAEGWPPFSGVLAGGTSSSGRTTR